jgi:hypothetical protein
VVFPLLAYHGINTAHGGKVVDQFQEIQELSGVCCTHALVPVGVHKGIFLVSSTDVVWRRDNLLEVLL